jgi:HSP20 family protein
MDRVFTERNQPWGVVSGWLPVENWPRANLYESRDYLEMKAEVSGCTKDDLNVKIQGNYLEISGERKSEAPEGYTAHRVERGTASFSRSFTLPTEVDADKVEATLKNGILTLKLPKSEAAKPKQITIS